MATVPLLVRVSKQNGISGYQFFFLDAPVPMAMNQGVIHAPEGPANRLSWIMIGEPGGWMKVEVLHDDDVVMARNHSAIPNSASGGDDSLPIQV